MSPLCLRIGMVAFIYLFLKWRFPSFLLGMFLFSAIQYISIGDTWCLSSKITYYVMFLLFDSYMAIMWSINCYLVFIMWFIYFLYKEQIVIYVPYNYIWILGLQFIFFLCLYHCALVCYALIHKITSSLWMNIYEFENDKIDNVISMNKHIWTLR